MGRCWENRLSLRRMTFFALVAGAIAGAVLPPSVMTGDPTRMLVTFLGLVSASILPTVSLAIGSMSGTGRSVKRISALSMELEIACRALFQTFGWVAATIALLLLLSVVPQISGRWQFGDHLVQIDDVARRSIQSLVIICSISAVRRALKIPQVLLAVLGIKRDIALFEAQKVLRENAPTEEEMRQMFKTKEGFGAVVRIELPAK